jgi:RimJ/RimL family protein N-acetyltransferase
LRSWTEDDVPALVEECNDEQVRRWLPTIPVPYTAEDALAFVRGEVQPDEQTFAMTLDGSVVGSIGLTVSGHRGTIGYWVAADSRGHGICTRALCVVSRFALEELQLRRLELLTDPDNAASQRVAEKVGFQREGVLRAHLPHRDGRVRDGVMFSLLPGELRE